MRTEVVIATRNEPDLQNTIASIKANSNCTVRPVEDVAGMGPQFMRHTGIMQSSADVIIIMDGHMRVKPHTLDAAAEYVGSRGNKVACLRCHHSEREDWTTTPYAGASLQLKAYGKDANEPQSFVAKWRRSDKIGKVGAVMGACYVFRRDWYVDGLRCPWQAGTGWGCDEELISAATWLRGGEVELLPWVVWHQARKPNSQPFRYTERQLLGLYANRLRLLLMMPMPMQLRNELTQHMMGAIRRGAWEKAAKIVDESEDFYNNYRQFLQSGGMSWDDFETQILGKETVKMASMMEMREQAKAAGITVPFGCKKADLRQLLQENGCVIADPQVESCDECDGKEAHKLDCSTREEPQKEPKTKANWGVNELNGRKERGCTHCGGSNTTTVRTRPTVGRVTIRDRKCLSCGRPFCTKEIS